MAITKGDTRHFIKQMQFKLKDLQPFENAWKYTAELRESVIFCKLSMRIIFREVRHKKKKTLKFF